MGQLLRHHGAQDLMKRPGRGSLRSHHAKGNHNRPITSSVIVNTYKESSRRKANQKRQPLRPHGPKTHKERTHMTHAHQLWLEREDRIKGTKTAKQRLKKDTKSMESKVSSMLDTLRRQQIKKKH